MSDENLESQVDVDVTKLTQTIGQTKQELDKAEQQADKLQEKARELAKEIQEDEGPEAGLSHKVEHKLLIHPLTNVARLGPMAAFQSLADSLGDDASSGVTSSIGGRIGNTAFNAFLRGGPEMAAIAALSATVETLIDEYKDHEKKIQEERARRKELAAMFEELEHERQKEADRREQEREDIRDKIAERAEKAFQEQDYWNFTQTQGTGFGIFGG